MGTFLIGLGILALASWIFSHVWKLALKFFYYAVLGVTDIVRQIIVAVRRAGKVLFILYKRHRDGKVYRVNYTEEEVNEDDVPQGLKEELDVHDEVIVKKGEIDSSEF